MPPTAFTRAEPVRRVEKTVISCRADLQEPAPEPAGHKPRSGSGVPAERWDLRQPRTRRDGRLAARARERHTSVHDLLAQGRTIPRSPRYWA